MKKILVLGAPADQGIPLLTALKARGLEPTAGVRRAGAMAATPHPDVPEVAADLYDDHDLGLSAHDGRRDIERAIHDSGVPYVIIEPMVFMDNIARIWSRPAIVNSGVFAYPAAETLKISWVCLEDVAAYMASALLHEDLVADRIAVGGPEALVGAEVAERLSVAAGRPVRFQSLSPDEFAARMSELVTGLRDVQPASIYDGMAKFYRWYNDQPVSPVALDTVPAARLLGVTPTPFADWAARQDWS